jgi:hypothetical protein
MSYYSMGATTDGPFKMVNGIAKPTSKETLDAFKAFQSAVSRFDSSVRADGDIGPSTASAYNKITGGKSTVEQVASLAATQLTTKMLELRANSEGKPAARPTPPSRPAAKPDGTIAEMAPPPMTSGSVFDSATGFLTSPMGLATVAGVVGVLIFMKRKKGSSAPAMAAAILPVP